MNEASRLFPHRYVCLLRNAFSHTNPPTVPLNVLLIRLIRAQSNKQFLLINIRLNDIQQMKNGVYMQHVHSFSLMLT